MTKIMLVEDDKSLREIYGVRLLAEGYDIVSAGDGEEALAMAIKDRPQLIISDVMMPKISGFDMLDILRSTTETKDIKVIMMTALSSDEQRQRGEQLGADKYLVKSQVGIEDVVKAVHEVLGDKPTAGQGGPVTPSQPIGPNATGSAPVSDITNPAPAAPSSTIPQPTAPFTGQRPANLGERVIQPLKDNPRVSSVDVGELMDKEFASNIQSVENLPEPADLNVKVDAPTPQAAPAPAAPTNPVAPIQSVDAVSMDPPLPPQPAADDMTLPTPAAPTQMDTPTPQVATPAPDPVVTSPLSYEDPAPEIPPSTPVTPAPAPATQQPTNIDTQPVAIPDRPDTPLTPPERT